MNKIEDMLIKRGICIKCGLAKALEGKYMCSWCQKEEQNKPKKSYYTRSPGNETKQEKQKKQRKYTLDEVSQMAKERGISYGQMVILLERGKE